MDRPQGSDDSPTRPDATGNAAEDAPRAPVCPQCGYDLWGIPEQRCPECGFRYQWAAIRRMSAGVCARREAAYRSATVCGLLAVVLFLAPALRQWGLAYGDRVFVLTLLLAALLIFRKEVGNGPLTWFTDHWMVGTLVVLTALPCAVVLGHYTDLGYFLACAASVCSAAWMVTAPQDFAHSVRNLPPGQRRRYARRRAWALGSLAVAAILLMVSR